jgi:hypothetical protein
MNKLKEKIAQAKSLNEDYVITYQDIVNQIDNENKKIDSIEDLVMVHVTDYMPKGRISSPLETHKEMQRYCEIDYGNGKKDQIPFIERSFRNTVHFCLNCQVTSHEFGNWDIRKYAVFIPMDKINGQIKGGREVDTYTIGGVNLSSESYILCPANEVQEMKKINPGVNIIGYEGQNVSLYVDTVISLLGYKVKQGGKTSWGNSDIHSDLDIDKVQKLFEKNNWPIIPHFYSEERQEESLNSSADMNIQILCNAASSLTNLETDNDIEQARYCFGSCIHDILVKKTAGQIIEIIKKQNGIDLSNTDLYAADAPLSFTGGKKSDHINSKEDYLKLRDAKYRYDEIIWHIADILSYKYLCQIRMQNLQKKATTTRLTADEQRAIDYEKLKGGYYDCITSDIGTRKLSSFKEKDYNDINQYCIEKLGYNSGAIVRNSNGNFILRTKYIFDRSQETDAILSSFLCDYLKHPSGEILSKYINTETGDIDLKLEFVSSPDLTVNDLAVQIMQRVQSLIDKYGSKKHQDKKNSESINEELQTLKSARDSLLSSRPDYNKTSENKIR